MFVVKLLRLEGCIQKRHFLIEMGDRNGTITVLRPPCQNQTWRRYCYKGSYSD